MCSRYDNLIPREAYAQLFGAERMPQSNWPPRYNVAPTDPVPIVRVDPRDGVPEVAMARWGLVPPWSKAIPKIPHINARAETVGDKPLFRKAFARRRCLVPATGFFEWEKRPDGKQPFRFTTHDGEPMALAGLWEYARIDGADLLSTTIIVTTANALVEPIHDRMPVILPATAYDTWLDRDAPAEDVSTLLAPYDPVLMRATEVSRVVNSVRNDVPECVEPIGQ
ncbi:MAG: SOS response-associated peptidase [Hyphomicrobiales bacterium]|nr:SOS response-associated peptidase [Hyphomicrobiales bacterium]